MAKLSKSINLKNWKDTSERSKNNILWSSCEEIVKCWDEGDNEKEIEWGSYKIKIVVSLDKRGVFSEQIGYTKSILWRKPNEGDWSKCKKN